MAQKPKTLDQRIAELTAKKERQTKAAELRQTIENSKAALRILRKSK